MACVLFGKVGFLKSASRFLAKVLVSLVLAFSPGLFFLASFVFFAKSVYSKGFGKSSVLAFGQINLIFNGKVRLVKN